MSFLIKRRMSNSGTWCSLMFLMGITAFGFVRMEAAEKPNIIVLVTDDQRWDTLGVMGNDTIQTPNLDRLAKEGALFTQAYVTTSICWASRASILTGQYDRRHGVLNNRELSDAQNQLTYPLLFKEAGYRIGFVGKYGVGNAPEEAYDYWDAQAKGQPDYEHEDEQGNYLHYTEICEQSAVQFLESHDGAQPFCLSVSFKAPHVQDGDPRQFIYNPEYADLYSDVEFKEPETAGYDFFYGAFPSWFTQKNEARKRWRLRFASPEMFQQSMKGYYRLITGVDDAVATIRKTLEERGLADNTIIVFLGDNGFYLAEHGMAGKWYGHQESIRIPLIVYDPRTSQSSRGIQVNEIALNVDVAPTLMELAGLPPHGEMQGESLLPLLEGKDLDWREDFLYEHMMFLGWPIYPTEGVVSKHYKYLRYPESEPPFEELYDLSEDPLEKNNLAQDAAHYELLKRMRARCDALIQQRQ